MYSTILRNFRGTTEGVSHVVGDKADVKKKCLEMSVKNQIHCCTAECVQTNGWR